MKTLIVLLLGILSFQCQTLAVLTFTIDTFTADELSISIPVSGNTLDDNGNGSPPSSPDLFIIDATSRNNDWVLGEDFSLSTSGSIGGAMVEPISGGVVNNDPSGGDSVSIAFLSPLSNGATVDSLVTASWTGSNIFDPSAVSSLVLTWGFENRGSVDPWGDVQGTTAVPEPPAYGTFAGVAAVLFVACRRRRLAQA